MICEMCNVRNANRTRTRCATCWNFENYGSCLNGCATPANSARGWCSNCNKRGGKPQKRNLKNPKGMRHCSSCKEIFKLEEFTLHTHRCKQCQTDYKKYNRIYKKYGLSKQEFLGMLEDQSYQCKICEKSLSEDSDRANMDRINIDHCHETGVVRGILCDKCNLGLGHFEDDVLRLQRAVRYLLDSSAPSVID